MVSLDMSGGGRRIICLHSIPYVDLEEEFQLMRKMGLPTRLINSYNDQEDEVHAH